LKKYENRYRTII